MTALGSKDDNTRLVLTVAAILLGAGSARVLFDHLDARLPRAPLSWINARPVAEAMLARRTPSEEIHDHRRPQGPP